VFPIHHNESFYPKPFEYDAFRFSDMREKTAVQLDLTDEPRAPSKGNPNESRLGLTSTSSKTYFAWGSGRHAWYVSPLTGYVSEKELTIGSSPGRFLASSIMKLIMIYLVTNYDLEPTGIRHPNKWFGSLILPPGSATIRLKRRGLAAGH
jgi:hypothetical protein